MQIRYIGIYTRTYQDIQHKLKLNLRVDPFSKDIKNIM